jgi:hypothetical protein
MFFLNRLAAFLLAVTYLVCMPAPLSAAEGNRAEFSISFRGLTSDLQIISTTIMPGRTLEISTRAEARSDQGHLSREDHKWVWRAPMEPGLASLEFTRKGDVIRLNVFVLTPWTNGGRQDLNGYMIGDYPKKPLKGLAAYNAPEGFIEVTRDLMDEKVSPNFTLGQFLCKQQPGHDPTYVLIRAATLIKLERLLEAVKDKGWKTEGFHIMSGFRTPYYNKSIGNRTSSSRHLYGGAVDIFIDADGDGRMDDLNGDGKVSRLDAHALAALAETLSHSSARHWAPGGIAVYGSTASHGPFVHIDSRGHRARW